MEASDIGIITSDRRRFEMQGWLSISACTAEDIREVLEEAERLSAGEAFCKEDFSAVLLMLQPSLRTQLGFAEAVRRLGGVAHVVSSRRSIVGGTASESLPDTIRVVSGLTDVVIVRADGDVAASVAGCERPVVNAGDDLEHPSQALVDLFAFRKVCGDWSALRIGVCGDLQMRAARSLLKALVLAPPAELRMIAPPSRRGDAGQIVRPLGENAFWGEAGEVEGLDILYLCGLPEHGAADHLDEPTRVAYAFNGVAADRLPESARVFSPMPVIDEISTSQRSDPRIAVYRQSVLGIYPRMALLRRLLSH